MPAQMALQTGGYAPWELSASPVGYLTFDQIKEMADSGIWSVASHTLTHISIGTQFETDIPQMPTPTDLAHLMDELTTSKQLMEDATGLECDWLIYPAHRISNTGYSHIRRAGYKWGASSTPLVGIDSENTLREIRLAGYAQYSPILFDPQDDMFMPFRLPYDGIFEFHDAIADGTVEKLWVHGSRNCCQQIASFFHRTNSVANFVGGHITEAEFEYLIGLLVDNDILVISPEEYTDMLFSPEHRWINRPMVKYSDIHTKGFNFAYQGHLRSHYASPSGTPTETLPARCDSNFHGCRDMGWRTDVTPLKLFSKSGGPLSEIDGKECGFIRVAFSAGTFGVSNRFYIPPTHRTPDGFIPVVVRLQARQVAGVATNALFRLVCVGAPGVNTFMGGTSSAGWNYRHMDTWRAGSAWTTVQFKFLVPAASARVIVGMCPALDNGSEYEFSDLQCYKVLPGDYAAIPEGLV